MKIKNILVALLCGICLCSSFAFTACKENDKNDSSVKQEQNGGNDDEDEWTKNY